MVTKVLEDGAEAYETRGGITVKRRRREAPYATAISSYVDKLDEHRGAVFSSNYEYPGRYTRWDTAVVDPPLGISSFGRSVWIEAYNARGEVLLSFIRDHLKSVADITPGTSTDRRLDLTIDPPSRVFTEEERSKMPTVFTVLRAVSELFHSAEDANLGLYGAFGYDLAFQFDAIDLKLTRPDDQRDMVLFLPDEILVVDHYSAKAWIDRSISAMRARRPKAATARLPAKRSARPPRSRPRVITGRANMPNSSSRRRRASAAAICSKWFPGRNSTSAAKASRRRFPSD